MPGSAPQMGGASYNLVGVAVLFLISLVLALSSDKIDPSGSQNLSRLLGCQLKNESANRRMLEMIKAQGGIFGWVSNSENFIKAIS